MAENKTITIPSNLRVYDSKSKVKIETHIENVISDSPFYLHFDITQLKETEKLDYIDNQRGTLVCKSSLPKKELAFDVNDKGELIAIGLDSIVSNLEIDANQGTLIFDNN
jgi:hypothetical protein